MIDIRDSVAESDGGVGAYAYKSVTVAKHPDFDNSGGEILAHLGWSLYVGLLRHQPPSPALT